MPETFTWSPQNGFTGERTPDVAVVKLGDGYEQRQVKGINPLMGKYPLTFIGYDDSKCTRPNVAKSVDAFLKARMAVESFYWTPFDTGVRGLYRPSLSSRRYGLSFGLAASICLMVSMGKIPVGKIIYPFFTRRRVRLSTNHCERLRT